MRRLGAAPRVGHVDDVIVQQRCRVDHLCDLRELLLLRIAWPAAVGRHRCEQHERRPEALSGEVEKLLRDTREYRVLAADEVAQQLVQRS